MRCGLICGQASIWQRQIDGRSEHFGLRSTPIPEDVAGTPRDRNGSTHYLRTARAPQRAAIGPPAAARAAGGNTAAPPSSVMKSRRFNWPNCIRPRQAGPGCKIPNWRGSVSGYEGDSATTVGPSSSESAAGQNLIGSRRAFLGRSTLGSGRTRRSTRTAASCPTEKTRGDEMCSSLPPTSDMHQRG